MIWSVSMLLDGITTVRERMRLIGSMSASAQELARIGDASTHRGRRSGGGACEQGARAAALAAFEIAVAGAHAVLALRHGVAVHAEAHRAPRLAPLRTGIREHLGEAASLRLVLHLLRTRHHEHAYARRNLAPGEHLGRDLEVRNAGIG